MAEIVQIGDDFIIAKGKFSQHVVDKVWMPIKKKGLIIPKSVVMLPPTHDAVSDQIRSTFSFVIAGNVIDDAISNGKIVGKIGQYDQAINQQLLNQAVTAFADALVAYCDGETPQELANTDGDLIYA